MVYAIGKITATESELAAIENVDLQIGNVTKADKTTVYTQVCDADSNVLLAPAENTYYLGIKVTGVPTDDEASAIQVSLNQ